MSDILANRINAVKSKLLAQEIKVKQSWLDECINFFINQTQIDDEALYQTVKEQFLLADVVEASNPVIPAQIFQKKEPFTLHGNFVLQLIFLIDIGKFNISYKKSHISSQFQLSHLMNSGEECIIFY